MPSWKLELIIVYNVSAAIMEPIQVVMNTKALFIVCLCVCEGMRQLLLLKPWSSTSFGTQNYSREFHGLSVPTKAF